LVVSPAADSSLSAVLPPLLELGILAPLLRSRFILLPHPLFVGGLDLHGPLAPFLEIYKDATRLRLHHGLFLGRIHLECGVVAMLLLEFLLLGLNLFVHARAGLFYHAFVELEILLLVQRLLGLVDLLEGLALGLLGLRSGWTSSDRRRNWRLTSSIVHSSDSWST